VEVLHPAGTVLDAGRGTGLSTQLLLACDEVKALDFSAASLRTLQGKLGARDHLDAGWGELRDLPFPDATFDCVLCANALSCLSPEAQARAAADTAARVEAARALCRQRASLQPRQAAPQVDQAGAPRGSRAWTTCSASRARNWSRCFPAPPCAPWAFTRCRGACRTRLPTGKLLDKMQVGHMLIAYGRKPH
jgi:SAM-dependent methyltransferase